MGVDLGGLGLRFKLEVARGRGRSLAALSPARVCACSGTSLGARQGCQRGRAAGSPPYCGGGPEGGLVRRCRG